MSHKVHATYVEKAGARFSWCGLRNPHYCTVSISHVTCKRCLKATGNE